MIKERGVVIFGHMSFREGYYVSSHREGTKVTVRLETQNGNTFEDTVTFDNSEEASEEHEKLQEAVHQSTEGGKF